MSEFRDRTQYGGRWRRGIGRGRGKDTDKVTEEAPPKSSNYTTEISAKTPRHTLTQGFSELCELHVSGPCHCSRLHHRKRSPYVWQYQTKPGEWSLLSNVGMELLEQAFCNNEDRTVVEIKRFGDVKLTTVTFDEIIEPPSRKSVNKFSFQRLSTRSYSQAGSDSISIYTQWVWYWKDNDGKWSPFVPPELQLTLETKYLAGQDTYLYTIADQEYRLDFASLVQVNRKYKTRRLVQRRPIFVSLDDARDCLNTCSSLLMSPAAITPTDVPSNWTPLDRYQDSEKVELDTSSDEFTTVMSSIYKTLSATRCQVQRVYRLQNALLWHNFHSMKKAIQMSQSTESIDQRQLFHGTDTLDVVNNICINNFDFRVSGKNATMYGKGAYFARDAKYSHSYTKGRDRYMFLARVLVGKYTLGDSSYTRPPPRKGHVLYDSCVNDLNNPSIFIIFERNQCYPDYLVEYRDPTIEESGSVNGRNAPRGNAVTSVASVASVASSLKHSSRVQSAPVAPSPAKTPSVQSAGNSSLNHNPSIPATTTVSTSSSSSNQLHITPGQSNTLKHSSRVQSTPVTPSPAKATSVQSTGNSSLNHNPSIPATTTVSTSSSSSNQLHITPGQSNTLKHSSRVQSTPVTPSPAKAPSVQSTGNSSLNQNQTLPTTNTVSAFSSSSSNQRQAPSGQSNTSASSTHTPPSKRSSVGNDALLGLGSHGRGQGCGGQTSSPVLPVPGAPSQTKTPSVQTTGNSSLNQNPIIPATKSVSASFDSNNQPQINPGQSNTSASSTYTPPSRRRPSVGNRADRTFSKGVHGQAALSQTTSTTEGSGLNKQHQPKDKSSDSTLAASTLRHSVTSQKTSSNAGLRTSNNNNEMDTSRACCQNKQSQIYYKVSSTRNTATYVRWQPNEDGQVAYSATYPFTRRNSTPVQLSEDKKQKDCTIL